MPPHELLRRDGTCRACPIITFLYIDRCNLHFGLTAARRCRSIRRKSSTIQTDRKRAGKNTLPLENAKSFWLSLNFLDEICTCWLFNTRRKPPFPYLSSAGQDRKRAGDAQWPQGGLILSIDACRGCARSATWCNTIEISTHIVRAHNMPCHHHQDTYQQETTYTPLRVPFKSHPNTEKYLANTA